jgi:hypothetical protein
MEDENNLDTHLWADLDSREVKINGRPVNLFRCSRCAREFAREADQLTWKAVSVGPFQVDVLDDAVSRRWISEPCPGRSQGDT